MKYGRQKTGLFESERGHKKNAARSPIGIKALQLIKRLRNLAPLLHWPYAGQGKTCCLQVPTIQQIPRTTTLP